jgi:ribosome biogenesis protein BMS1
MPNIMGILTHLDYFRENKAMRKTKKKMKKRFWKEVHDGAKLFYFSGQ